MTFLFDSLDNFIAEKKKKEKNSKQTVDFGKASIDPGNGKSQEIILGVLAIKQITFI